ncbi:MAG: geranylgeranylglyceryl/heptaprenylglyceryl phosphate synthase [Brevinematia bacterium]
MKQIIPAMDIYDGKVVRLTRGDFSQRTEYSDNPLELVKFFKSGGVNRIHLVDLEGAKSGQVKILDLVRSIKSSFSDVMVQFGGGIRSYEIARSVLEAGADFIVIGTMFFEKPEEFQKILNDFREKVILSLDINVDKVVIRGWQLDSQLTVEESFGKAIRMGVLRIMSTDVSRDGTLLGPNVTFISSLVDTLKRKYFDVVIDEVMNLDSVKSIVNEGLEVLTRSVNSFIDTLKSPYSGNYEVRKKIEEYDENIAKYKEVMKISIPWDMVFKKYPKPFLIISGGISSDSDIEEIFRIDDSFIEGVIVGKSIYEGRLSLFSDLKTF